MSGRPADQHPAWAINLDLARACAGFGLAWVFWQMHSPAFWMFGFIAVACALAGVKRLGMALFGIGKLILGRRKVGAYRKQGAVPKADALASEAELKLQGLIK